MAQGLVAALRLGYISFAAGIYTNNPICIKNNCINPIFPGLEDLHRLANTTKWYCTSMEDTALAIGFCKGAVNYHIAVPEPQVPDESSVQALVRKQDRAANTAYFAHLNGLGKDPWEHPDPENSDDCIRSIWKMVCYTYFPRAEPGCARGSLMEYIRPCQSSCANYINACSVECCDESVQCVFTHQKKLTKTTVLATSGYEPHDGPSSFCTGSAHRSGGFGLALLLAVLSSLSGETFGFRLRSRPSVVSFAVLGVFLSVALQGCDSAVVHSIGNWRQEEDHLVKFQFVPPGASSKEAVLNSCSLPGLSPTLQCSGHGGCHTWEKTADANPTQFCRCDAEWADPECRTRRKSQVVAYLLATFLGVVGADRFYLGLVLSGWLKLLALGSLTVFWITEVLITGSAPVNLNKDLRSWGGLMKVLTFLALGSWYFIDVIRTGSAPVETNSFRTAADLPREAVKDTVGLLDAYGLRKDLLIQTMSVHVLQGQGKQMTEGVVSIAMAFSTCLIVGGREQMTVQHGVHILSVPRSERSRSRSFPDVGATTEAKVLLQMKIKVLQRSQQDYLGATSSDITRHFRNADPDLHPFERAREYQRALKAIKMEKIFAKPFVKALEGHTDSVKCMAIARKGAAPLLSGSCNGELRLWNMQHLICGSAVTKAHEGFVRGVTMSPDGRLAFSCGDDKAAKMWRIQAKACEISEEPEAVYHMAYIPGAIDHHWQKKMFVTVGDTVDVWDYSRSTPVSSFEWGCERVITSRFNPAESALLASTAVDRSVGLYDLRGNAPIRKVILKLRSNGICWNPMRPMSFTVANEDCSLYTFDMRKLSAATGRHWDHVMAVLDVDYAPNGQEFVSASYDNTVRLWDVNSQRSKEVYHGKRMQRVLCCHYTPDGRFVLSGSEDTNIRVWKAKADQKLGVASARESRAEAYREVLKKKFSKMPEIARIKRHKHVPKMIKSIGNKRRIMKEARQRKDANRRKHSKPGTMEHEPMKKRLIVKELE
ncbi:DDB1- and CUL4-associated factor 13 (WD repeat and SOF domain-containing protein 1) [Durusdinium trenchii]|uniref:DDB1- and CUL4-associated factor 13 n=1 Tax=Durusdinium trenchii TaxID=1381693 RepID=A0ABP0M0B9_9DINO